jgi:hypothetical protein
MWMYRNRTSSSAKAWASALAATLAFAVVGLELLDPDTLLSVDAAVKLLQAQELLVTRWRSLAIPYPGSLLDAGGNFFPFAAPFVLRNGSEWQGVFPTAVALLNAAFLTIGSRGLVLLSVVSGGITVLWSARISARESGWVVGALLTTATCFWFYAVLPWEHAPAAALSTSAFVTALDARAGRKVLIAALLLGCAIALREESALLIPGFLWAVRRYRSGFKVLLTLVALCSVPTLIVTAADVWFYARPPSAHVQHALDRFLGNEVTIGTVPSRTPRLSLATRFDIVVQDWLLGVRGLAYSSVCVAVVALIALARRRPLTRWGSVLVAAVFVGQATRDLIALVPNPSFVSGLLRLSPMLIFAALPSAVGGLPGTRRIDCLVAGGAFLTVSLLLVSLTGGASLGPRFLIPILPILMATAWDGLESYRTSGHLSPLYRITWGLGVALVAASVLMQSVAVRAYVTFNRVEREAVQWVRDSPEPVVVDSPFTASVAAPVYLDRPVFRAETQQDAASLAAILAKAGVRAMLLVSREEQQHLEFPPFALVQKRRAGHTTVQRWAR